MLIFRISNFNSGVNTPPENERVKALSEACLDRSYLGFITNPKNGRVKGLNEVSLDRTYLGFITNPKNGEVKALSVSVP